MGTVNFRPRQFLSLSMLSAFVCIDCTVCVRYACVGRCTHSFCLKCQYVSEECDLLFIQNPRATFSKYATCLAIRLFALRGVKLLHNLPIACLSARQAQPLTQLSLPLRFFPPLLGENEGFFFLIPRFPDDLIRDIPPDSWGIYNSKAGCQKRTHNNAAKISSKYLNGEALVTFLKIRQASCDGECQHGPFPRASCRVKCDHC